MSNPRTFLGAVAGVLLVVILAWYVAVFRPKASEIKEVTEQVAGAKSEAQSFEATLKRLESVDADRPEFEAELRRLTAAIPPQPELASFILSAHNLAARANLAWLSISPSLPSSVPGTDVSQISMDMELAGQFFDVVDYLQRVEDLERIVVIDAVELRATAADEDGDEEAGGGGAALGAPGSSGVDSQPVTLSGAGEGPQYQVTTDVATIGATSVAPSTPTSAPAAAAGGEAGATTLIQPPGVFLASSRLVRVTLSARAFTTAPPQAEGGAATTTTTTTAPAGATTTTAGG